MYLTCVHKYVARMHTLRTHRDLEVYQNARAAAAFVFRLTLRFPAEERYGLTTQSRNSSRSVSANIAEGWRKRRYPAAFRSKLNDAEGEAAETQGWLDVMLDCGYITEEEHTIGDEMYDKIIAQLVRTVANAKSFCAIH
jgi:four helix bundle protein